MTVRQQHGQVPQTFAPPILAPPCVAPLLHTPPLAPGLDAWHLAAVEQLTSACKSVVVAAALLHGRITPQEAMDASRLEESFQIEDWGMVEAGHDLDIADITTRVSAPALMVRLLEMGGGPQG